MGGSTRQAGLKFRSAINGANPQVVLIEAERAEDVIKTAYESLLKKTAGSAMNDVLMRHYSEVKKHQAWMLQTTSATNRFSRGMSATRIDDLCKVEAQGE